MEIKASVDFRDNYDELAVLANTELEFINRVGQELKEKGVHKALLRYKKNKY
jgi:hypothetical protein